MSTRFSGGGGSSGIFPWSTKAYAIQWRGGVVAEIVRALKKTMRIGGGGGSSAEFFVSVTYKQNFPFMGNFYALLHFFTFPKGGPGKVEHHNCREYQFD